MRILKQFERHRWGSHGQSLPFEDGNTHLWIQPLPSLAEVAPLLSIFDIVEGRSPIDSEREQTLAARGILRLILAQYLQIDPELILLGHDATGSYAASRHQRIRYSQVHIDHLFLAAISSGDSAGLALERVRTDLAVEDLAKTYLEPEQAWEVLTSRGLERVAHFYRHWTISEAMSQMRRAEDVAPTVWTFEPAPGYTAAVAVPKENGQLIGIENPVLFTPQPAAA